MTAGATYEPIATSTLSSQAAAITFSSIPATYTDLRLVVIAPYNAVSSPPVQITSLLLNNDSASNYSYTEMDGNGSAAGSVNDSNLSKLQLSVASGMTTSGQIQLFEIDIFSYASSNYKTVLGRSSSDFNGSGSTSAQFYLWRNTAAITSIKVFQSFSTYQLAAGTTATLYGIAAA